MKSFQKACRIFLSTFMGLILFAPGTMKKFHGCLANYQKLLVRQTGAAVAPLGYHADEETALRSTDVAGVSPEGSLQLLA